VVRSLARAIAFGLIGVGSQMAVLTGFIWGCLAISGSLFTSPIGQVIAVAVLLIVASPIVLPLLSIIMVPVTLVIAWPLDLIFPDRRDKAAARSIRWCRTCAHYRKSKEFEDSLGGLWHAASMPRSDKLPCKIPVETSDVWAAYFSTEPKARTLFPKDCRSFTERR
jgi:hypothetical protein